MIDRIWEKAAEIWKVIGLVVIFNLMVGCIVGFVVIVAYMHQTGQLSVIENGSITPLATCCIACLAGIVLAVQWLRYEASVRWPNEPVVLHDIGGDEYHDVPTFLEPDRLQALRDQVGR